MISDPGRRVIFTADDYGACDNIDAGIETAIEAGAINTVSALVTFPDSIERIGSLRRRFPDVHIGLHLCVTAGSPVYQPDASQSLIDPLGNFHTIEQIMARVHALGSEEVERELRAQIALLSEIGIEIDHLSSHHNLLWLYTPLFETVVRLAGEYRLPMRSALPASMALDGFAGAATRRRGLKLALRLAARHPVRAARLRRYANLQEMRENESRMDRLGIRHPAYLIDTFWGKPTPGNLRHILFHLPAGVSEIVFHLGTRTLIDRAPSGIDGGYFANRELELASLTSREIQRDVAELHIEAIAYDDL